MKCKTCQTPLQKDWNYCPKCGIKMRVEEGSFSKLSYAWEREISGHVIYDNFKAVRDVGAFVKKESAPVREKLGDFVHINFYNMRKFALLNYSPKFAHELFRIGKLTGYYDGELGIIAVGMSDISREISRTDKFIKVGKLIHDNKWDYESYLNVAGGLIGLKEIDEKNNRIIYTLDESTNYSVKSTKGVCYEDLGSMCGIFEALTGRFFNGRETKCHCTGEDKCEFEAYYTPAQEEPKLELITAEEAERILDTLVKDTVHRPQKTYRKTLGDYVYISYDQCMNYLSLHSSKGQEVLAKYCGSQVGEKIAKEAELTNINETVECLHKLFEWMRIGLLESKTEKDKATIELKESVYSSGVNNINMKLDTYIAGIIEGTLKQATKQKWQAEETKCTANGNEHCEFTCKQKSTTAA